MSTTCPHMVNSWICTRTPREIGVHKLPDVSFCVSFSRFKPLLSLQQVHFPLFILLILLIITSPITQIEISEISKHTLTIVSFASIRRCF